jgi:hypothetical protein
MKKAKSMKSVWSPEDLQEYLAGAANAYKTDRDWQEILDMLTKGGGTNGSDQPETPHLLSSLEVTRRIQIVREYPMTIPRRGLTGGTEGKTLTPFQSILRQVSDILQTPLIQAGAVSPGAQGSAASPQTTEVEEAKLAAGDPIKDEVAIAQASDILKTPLIQAGVVSPGAQGSATFPQTTEVEEVRSKSSRRRSHRRRGGDRTSECHGNGVGGRGGGKRTRRSNSRASNSGDGKRAVCRCS